MLVLVDADEDWRPERRGGGYERRPFVRDGSRWQAGAWPYTPEIVERHRQAKLARRRAAIETMKELSRRPGLIPMD